MIIDSKKLKLLCKEILNKAGCSEEHAIIIADSIVKADLRGIDTHGIFRLPMYIGRIQKNFINLEHKIKITNETDSYIVIDGDNGFGQVVTMEVVDLALKKARKIGNCIALIYNNNYLAMLAYYMLKVVQEDMIGIIMCNAPASVAPIGGIEARVGTNPLCVAIPTGKSFPIVLDMATSVAAGTKIVLAEQKGEEIPEGWALDKEGRSTTNPSAARKGTFLPLAGPKGFGLALVIDTLSGVLSGANYGVKVPSSLPELDNAFPNLGSFINIINIENFMPIKDFKKKINNYIDSIKSSKKLPGVSEILVPGEPEFRTEQKRIKSGIPINEETWQKIESYANNYKINLKNILDDYYPKST